MMKLLYAVAALLAVALPAHAQSNPHLTQGQVLTPAQWNNLFAGKQDTLGYTPMNVAGGTFTGRIVTAPPGGATSGFNLTPGSTPASPANGDLWVTSSGFFARVNGTTIGISSTSPVVVADPFPGSDIGAKINAAVASLVPIGGGGIILRGGPYTGIATPIVLAGAKISLNLNNSSLAFNPGVAGITCTTVAAQFSSVYGGSLIGSDVSLGTNDGLTVSCPFFIGSQLRITGFGRDGVAVLSNAASSPINQNADNWWLSSVLARSNLRDGIHVDGTDSNNGRCDGCEAQGFARNGFYDNSFIGNIYNAPNADNLSVAGVGTVAFNLPGSAITVNGGFCERSSDTVSITGNSTTFYSSAVGPCAIPPLSGGAAFTNQVIRYDAAGYPAWANFGISVTNSSASSAPHTYGFRSNEGSGNFEAMDRATGLSILTYDPVLVKWTTPAEVDLNDGLFILFNNSDPTKKVRFSAAGVTPGATRVVSIPDGSTTMVGTDLTQILSGKFISGATNTLSNIGNASLTNSTMNINGTTCTLGVTLCPVSASATSASVGTTTILSGTSHGVLTNNAGVLGNTAAGASGQLLLGITSAEPAFATMSGDATITNAGVLTLASVASAGTTGSSTAIPVITINAKGLTTGITTAAVVAPAGTLTGATLAAGVTGSSLTSVGTLTGGATGAGFTVALTTSTVSGTLPCANLPALTGDVTTSAGSCATAIGATKVTSAMLNADVFSTAHTWGGQQTFVAPVLGTPASGVATNLTGTAAGLTAGSVTTNANLTGAITSSGSNATSLGSFTSANLSGALTDETGSGLAVFGTSPTLAGVINFTGIISPNSAFTPTCGAGCSSVSGNDQKFKIVGSGTSVSITFGHTWPAAPVCTFISDQATSVLSQTGVNTTALTIGSVVTLAGNTINVHCW